MQTQTLGLVNQLYNLANTKQTNESLPLEAFSNRQNLASTDLNIRLNATLEVLLDLFINDNPQPQCFDNVLIDKYITKIDMKLKTQLDEILHHPDFQSLEATWRNIKYLTDNTDSNSNTFIELLDVDKQTLQDDFQEAETLEQSGLYQQLYVQEYDTPGGEPFAAMIADYDFNSSQHDISFLKPLANVAAITHCPFVASITPQFFNKSSWDEVNQIADLNEHMQRTEYIHWNNFRETEHARYIGLTMPRYLLRTPFDDNQLIKSFPYQEQHSQSIDNYLWGRANFAFAANLIKSFRQYGWLVNIRGPESGGKVTDLPLAYYDAGYGTQAKIPTQVLIPEAQELELANLGLIPLSYYKNSVQACFFSANSIQKPQQYLQDEATANTRINARLPYVFLCSRLAHYLKVLQRENIGTNKSRIELESELNLWLSQLVTRMNNPSPEIASLHPLRFGKVNVKPIDDNPGFFRIELLAIPHFQVEGVDVSLSLISQLPTDNQQEK